MSNPNAKTQPVKGYMSVDAYLATAAVLESVGMSMSTAINLGLKQVISSIRDLDTAHRTRRKGAPHMSKTGMKFPAPRPRNVPGRRGSAITPMRV